MLQTRRDSWMRETASASSSVFILGTGLCLGSGTGLLDLKGEWKAGTILLMTNWGVFFNEANKRAHDVRAVRHHG